MAVCGEANPQTRLFETPIEYDGRRDGSAGFGFRIELNSGVLCMCERP